MIAVPVIKRDLRIRSRRRGTYWLRAAVGLIAILVCVPQLMSSAAAGVSHDLGPDVFNALVVALFFVCCAACLLSSDAIGMERREGTLDLLLLTRVRGFDLLIGKFGSCSVAGLCAMMAFVPVLMVPVLAGGVTGGEAFRKALALLNTLFFTLASGLYGSSVHREPGRAGGLAVFIVLAFALFPWAFWLVGLLSPADAIGPLVATICAGDQQFSTEPAEYYVSMVTVQLAGWLLLGLACRRLGRLLRREVAAGRIFAVRGERIRRQPLSIKLWRRFETDPIGWEVFHQRGVRGPLWWSAGIVVIYAVLSHLISLYSTMAAWLLYGICSAGTDALLAIAAGRFFLENARSGQLELLLTTPVGANSILESQWRAMKTLLGWPLAVWISALMLQSTVWLIMIDADSPGRPGFLWTAKYLVTWSFTIVGTVLGAFLVCWVGMWIGLRTRSRLITAAWAAVLSTGVPALFRLLTRVVVDPVVSQFVPADDAATVAVVEMWLEQTLVLAYYVWAWIFVKRRLVHELSGGNYARPMQIFPIRLLPGTA